MTGGDRVVVMISLSHGGFQMRCQERGSRLAVPPGAFRDAVQRAAGAALGAPTLSARQRQLLHDLRRHDGPYQFRAVDDLLNALSLLPDTAPEYAFLEELRTAIQSRKRRNAARELGDALLRESEAEADANPAQMEVALGAHDLPHIEHALTVTIREREAADDLIHSLSAERFALLHGAAR